MTNVGDKPTTPAPWGPTSSPCWVEIIPLPSKASPWGTLKNAKPPDDYGPNQELDLGYFDFTDTQVDFRQPVHPPAGRE
ncbi:MAG: hypothetical protein U0871_26970 [Gemmataceae bacterium]